MHIQHILWVRVWNLIQQLSAKLGDLAALSACYFIWSVLQNHAYQWGNWEAAKQKDSSYCHLTSIEFGFLQQLLPLLHLYSCQHRLYSVELLEKQLGGFFFFLITFITYSGVIGETMKKGKDRYCLKLCPPLHQNSSFDHLRKKECMRDWCNS